MPVPLGDLIEQIDIERTVLFFGAGSSIPSGMPPAERLRKAFVDALPFADEGFSLAEAAELFEQQFDRKKLISTMRALFPKPNPTGGLGNIGLYRWKSIFTTNYDCLLETAFSRRQRAPGVISTNFDFGRQADEYATTIFKLHGSIERDTSDGDKARIILTTGDYEKAEEYREQLYARLQLDLMGSHTIIIGYSLNDPEIRAQVDKVLDLKKNGSGISGRITLFLYEESAARAALFERRGLQICYGGIDQFFAAIADKFDVEDGIAEATEDILGKIPRLKAILTDVSHAVQKEPNFSAMYVGWPATYADIANKYTFARTKVSQITNYLREERSLACVVLGASGVGKTTLARNAMIDLEASGWLAYEQPHDFELKVEELLELAKMAKSASKDAILMIDDADTHLTRLNDLVEKLVGNDIFSLKFLIVSSRNKWDVRQKSPYLQNNSKRLLISKLNETEIESLLDLVNNNSSIYALMEDTFSGFSKEQKKRRLLDRCESDTFVCLKNIFATEKFDDIILREFSSLDADEQDIYKLVSALETAGVGVHRQLVLRLTGLSGEHVNHQLEKLMGIVTEYDINPRIGIYGWRVRHAVVAAIITKYKYAAEDLKLELFDRVIDNISPTYEIELRTIREICNPDGGIGSLKGLKEQDRLYRKLISIAPSERVPRHRLIKNLIDRKRFEDAESEIRIFETELNVDNPVRRYKIMLSIARARNAPGLMVEDRVAILNAASVQARNFVSNLPPLAYLYEIYTEVGIELFKISGDITVFDESLSRFKAAEAKHGDPDMTRRIMQLERRINSQQSMLSESVP